MQDEDTTRQGKEGLPWKCIKEPGTLGGRKGDTHTGHEGRMKNHRSDLIAARQIHRRYRTYALTVKNDVFRAYAVPRAQRVPRGINVGVQVLFRRFPSALTIAGIIVAEYITVDALSETNEESCHLSQIDGIPVGKEQRKSGVKKWKTNILVPLVKEVDNTKLESKDLLSPHYQLMTF